jgi:DNA ligase-1
MNYDKFKPILGIGPPKSWGFTGESDEDGNPVFSLDLQMEKYLKHLESMLPLIGTPKLDGIRCEVKSDGHPLTRTLKDIPNGSIRAYFFSNREYIKDMFDGELIVGDSFNETSSAVMSHGGDPDFTYWIFDVPSDLPYKERVDAYSKLDDENNLPVRFKTVPTVWIRTIEDLLKFEGHALEQGYEGIMLRKPDSPYKFGRSTVKQGFLLKLKRFITAEARVVGFEPLKKNLNEATISETGHQVRSTHKAGMVVQNTLGKFLVEGINGEFSGVKFAIGSGLMQAQRDTFWEMQPRLLGEVIEYKYQPHGTKDAPRIPTFLRFRDASEFSDNDEVDTGQLELL